MAIFMMSYETINYCPLTAEVFRHLEFPNGVAVNDNQEVFISDNRAHCVKVFDYQGNYLRQIGGEGVSNFPIGVGVTASGDIAIADNHNNFNLTVFNQVESIHWGRNI